MRVEKSRAIGGRVADLSALTQFQSSLDRAPAMSVCEERALLTHSRISSLRATWR